MTSTTKPRCRSEVELASSEASGWRSHTSRNTRDEEGRQGVSLGPPSCRSTLVPAAMLIYIGLDFYTTC
jgi:hypothetical protein